MTQIIKKQIGENPSPLKTALFVVKAISGVVGASMVLEQSYPYVALGFLALGAAADQVIVLYNWKK